ncbi:MAG: DEAD/DEAH box helicase [Patescibacteria group bacterium]
MEFSKQAQQVIDTIENTNNNVFVTGKAGTGKSTLLEHIRLHSKKKMIVLAPTGISAINVNGETIHSFFGLKPGFELDEAREMRINNKKTAKFRRIKTIAIDEISMVRADLLDAIDTVLKRTRSNNEPFAGVQMIFFGDLFQLPPVVTVADRDKLASEYASPYFFDANVLNDQTQGNLFAENFELQTIELIEIYRQKDNRFIEVLNAVRNGQVDDSHLDELNSRLNPDFEPKDEDKYIHLVTTNDAAYQINSAKLRKLKNEQRVFNAKKEGKVARNLYPNDEEVVLSVGAQVMFICNDQERRWVNGTIGKIVDVKDSDGECVVYVEKNDGRVVKVKKHTWEISRYVFEKNEFKRDIMGSYTQVPLKLAWAITIHKSQGKTFDKVIIDLGRGAFAHGQTYVALSRCTSLEGIVLKKRFCRSSILMDKRVMDYCGN